MDGSGDTDLKTKRTVPFCPNCFKNVKIWTVFSYNKKTTFSFHVALNCLLKSSVGDPDPDLFFGSGSENFDRIQMRPPKGAYYQ
jgi:hypothetical protein